VVTGEEIQSILTDLSKTPPEKMAALDGHFKFKGPVEKVKLQVLRHTGKVLESKGKGRTVVIDHEGTKTAASVSGSRTKVSIDGKAAKRGAVKTGMTCTFVYYGPNSQAEELVCKN